MRRRRFLSREDTRGVDFFLSREDTRGVGFFLSREDTRSVGIFSFQGDHFGMGRYEGESTQSCEARFSPSSSPFPGTQLL